MFYLCPLILISSQKFVTITSMDPQSENSAYGMVTPSNHKPKPGRVSKAGAPVRVSFQQGASRPPVPHGRNSLGLSQTEGGFKKADFELALKNTEKKSNRVYKGEETGMCTESEHFKAYGPGICLFFQFQKSLINTFLVMSVVCLVPLVYNVVTGPVMKEKGSSLSYWIAASTVGNFNSNNVEYTSVDKYMNVIPDIIATFVFVVFYFYWLHKGEVITEEIRTQVKLKSYYTVELVDFPPTATEEEVAAFMGQFGTVLEVAPVRNYSETISLSKKIFDLEIELKEMELKKNQEQTADYDESIKQAKDKIDGIYKELVLYEDDTKEEVIQYYVMFTSIEDRENALKLLKQHEKKYCDCCAPDTPDNYKLCGEKVVLKSCHTEPADVIWENQHVTWWTRWMRVVVMYMLLLGGITLGFCVISFLNILVPSSSSSSVDTSSYDSSSIQSESNTEIVRSWCIANHVDVLAAGSSSSIYTFCYEYILRYYLKIAITVGIAIGICLIKFILKHFVIFLSSFKRYRTHTEQSKDMIQNLVFVYVATTVLVTLLLQAEMFGLSFKRTITYFISNDYLIENSTGLAAYMDFVSDWYVDIGYQIIFNALILVVHPTFTMPIFYCLMEKVSRCRASGQEVQAKMEKMLELPEFELESDYAQILTLVFMGLAFSGGMPAITIIVFVALLLRYFYQKFYFFRYCKVPKMFDEALDLQVTSLIPYGIIVHYAFSIWMFGNQGIFQHDAFSFSKLTADSQNSFVQSIGFILQRLFATWYYSIFFVLFLGVWMFKQILFNCVAKTFIGSQSHKIIPVKYDNKVESGSGTGFCSAISTKCLCDSYKIESNPDYVQVLQIMKRKRKFIVKVKNIEGEQIV